MNLLSKMLQKSYTFKLMKTYINISNVPVEVAEKVKAIAESEFDGNESAAYRKLLAEALEARAKKAKKGA